MKKIIISVTNDLVTDQRVHKTAMCLLKSDVQVTLVGRKLKHSQPLPGRTYSCKRIKLLFNKGPLFYVCYNIRLFFYLLFHKSHLLVSNDLDSLAANYLVSKIKRSTLVYDSHEYFTQVPELIDRKSIQKFWESIERRILPKVKISYTVCQSIADIYNKQYGINMQVVRNIPFLKKEQAKNSISIPFENKKIIIYQGAVNIGRGLELMIDTVKHLEDTVFVIAGIGDIFTGLKKYVDTNQLNDKVYFTGRIRFEDLSSLTRQAHLGISLEENRGLNYYYALPNKIFDYIHAGIPVLSSDFPEMKKIVEGFSIGLTTKTRDPKTLASIVKNMLNNIDKRKLWIENARKASQELCWENEEKKLIEIFRSAGLTF